MRRQRNKVIQDATSDFGAGSESVKYVAHAIMSNGTTVRIAKPTEGEGLGSAPTYHPDRAFWKQTGVLTLKELQGKSAPNATISRVEIDCTLMPCDAGDNGCLYTIPVQVKNEYGKDVDLWIFSHRDQGMGDVKKGKDGQPKRYIQCSTSSSKDELDTAMERNDGWDWA